MTTATKPSRTSREHDLSRYNALLKEKQRFLNMLFKKYSSLAQEKAFSDKFEATALAVCEEFDSADTLAYMDLHELTEFLQEKGKNHFSNPEEVAKAIQKAARSSYRLPKTVNNPVNQVLAISISAMRTLEAQIKEFETFASQMQLIPNTLISVKGIRPIYSAGIIAEIGDINRFPNQAKFALLNMLVFPGFNISPVTLRRKIHVSSRPKTVS